MVNSTLVSSQSDLVFRLKSKSTSAPVPTGSNLASPHPRSMRQTSAIPTHYYAIFAIYEPCLTTLGFLGALLDPKGTHDYQAPWPNGQPPNDLPLATKLTITQLGHVCALLGLLNIWLLSSARIHLSLQPALQEKIVSALLTPLLIGDVMHLYVTLWALGDRRWDYQSWSPMLIVTLVLGVSLLIPRTMWWLGIGRYVDSRDGPAHSPKS